MADTPDSGKYIVVDFSKGTDFPPVHANQMIVQHTEHEFIVTFFELLPPVVNPDPAIQAQQLAELTSIQARPVAKVVMSAARAREFVAAFAENLRKFDEDVKESAKEGAE